MTITSILCLCLAALFIWTEKKENYMGAVILKGLASLCFVFVGVMAGNGGQLAKLIVTGLLLGCIADILLNLRWVFPKKGQLIFLVGILVFLGGHVVYLAAVLPMADNWAVCVVVGVVLTALLMKWIFSKITAKKAFKIFGVFYLGAIMLLNCVAVSNLVSAPSAFTGLFAVGALLFLISDIVLILNTFGPKSKFSLRVTNLSLYYIGQLLIAWSMLFVK
ncbi:MAG: lysoplasmalogenase [Oscillospiraceae bacterium]|nr:lysoplasmalogenase [Oscillospiraceae bacterium]MBQ6428975.1 lysoplasmalogenase [Oscillospiraceae bacterium]